MRDIYYVPDRYVRRRTDDLAQGVIGDPDGFTDGEIAAIEAGDTADQPEDLKTAIAFTEEAVALIKVSRRTFDRTVAIFSSRDLVTMLLLIGHYMMVARLLETLEVDLDAAPDTFSREH